MLADYARCVEYLGVEHRAADALRCLMAAGMQATLLVRVGCCKVLDHFLDEDALPETLPKPTLRQRPTQPIFRDCLSNPAMLDYRSASQT